MLQVKGMVLNTNMLNILNSVSSPVTTVVSPDECQSNPNTQPND